MVSQTKTLTAILCCSFFCVVVVQETEEPGIQSTIGSFIQNNANETDPPAATNQPVQTSDYGNSPTQSMTTGTPGIATESVTINNTTLKPGNSTVDTTQNGQTIQGDLDDSITSSTKPTRTAVPSSTSTVVDTHLDNSSVTQTASPFNVTNSNIININASTKKDSPTSPVTVPPQFDRAWMDFFKRVHHFDGLYEYEGGRYSFDFVIMYVHPTDLYTLVAKFFDQDGAIIEMNGTSTDGQHIIFKQSDTFSADFRFTALTHLELDGRLVTDEGSSYYAGNVTSPVNSSFTWFHLNKGLGTVVTGDAQSTRTAIIIVIPASLAFLAVIGTTATLCWASKKGLFGRRHKSYLLFKDNPVSYESEAETIHI